MSLLRQLHDYEVRMRAEHGDGLPYMYHREQKVRYEVALNADGTFDTLHFYTDGAGKAKDSGKTMPAPDLVRAGSGANPRLLMDNAEYVLGVPKKDGPKGRERAEKYRQAFAKLAEACAKATGEASVQTIAAFLGTLDAEAFANAHLPDDFVPDQNVLLTVDGVNPLNLESVQEFWAAQFETEEGALEAECLVTGKYGPVMRTEPVKIKGILGGQTSGMNFISANAGAFESYGLTQSNIAPVRQKVAALYAQGLNRLLADPDTRLRTGGVTYAFWTGEGAVPLVGPLLEEPRTQGVAGLKPRSHRARPVEPADLKDTVQHALFKGAAQKLRKGAAFYAVGMTPSGSRVAVRTHLTTTVQGIVDNLAHFYAAQALQPIHDEDSKYPDKLTFGIYELVRGLYRDASKADTAPDVDALVQFALNGQPLPLAFLPKLLARNRAEQTVTRERAVLSKMVLISRPFKELNMDVTKLEALDPSQSEPAYHLGRLLAVLDDIQGSVMKANTTLVDRFYGSMSTTPYAVFGRLIQGSQAHLQKLRKNNEAAYYSKQRSLEDVLGCIRQVPSKPLNTVQQAAFALGYYHQRAHIRAEIIERTAAKKAKVANDKAADTSNTDNTKGDDAQ